MFFLYKLFLRKRLALCVLFGVLFCQTKLAAQFNWYNGVNPTTSVVNLNACRDTVFNVYCQNQSGLTISGNSLDIQLPANVSYVPGSFVVSSGSVAVAQGNISNLNHPIFTIADALNNQFFAFSYRVRAACLTSGGSSSTGITLTHNTGTSSPPGTLSSSFQLPSFSVINTTNLSYTGNVGTSYTQQITIRNGGLGFLDGNTSGAFIRVLLNGTSCLSVSNPSIGTLNGDTLIIPNTLINTIGDHDNRWENNEDMTISYMVGINCCSNLTRSIRTQWGCNASACETSTAISSNVIISNAIPNIVIDVPTPNYNFCNDGQTPYTIRLRVTNNGAGPASNFSFNINNLWPGSVQGYNHFILTTPWPIYNSSNVQIGTMGSFSGAASGTFYNNSCAGLANNNTTQSSAVNATANTGFIIPGNSVIYIDVPMKQQNMACAPYNCISGIGWSVVRTNTSYKNQCGTGNYTIENRIYQRSFAYFVMAADVPSDIVPGNFNIDINFTQFRTMNNPSGTGLSQLILPLLGTNVLPAVSSITIGSYICPVTVVNDTMFVTFPQNVTSGGISTTIPMIATCGTNGPRNLNFAVLNDYDTTCPLERTVRMGCITATTNLHCPVSCPRGGATPLSFSLLRKTRGRPDNNNDHLPDASGTLDLTKVKLHNCVNNDTLTGTWNIKILGNTEPTDPNTGLPHTYTYIDFDQKNNSTVPACENKPFAFKALPNATVTIYPAGGGAPISGTVTPTTITGTKVRYNLNTLRSPWLAGDSIVVSALFVAAGAEYASGYSKILTDNYVYSTYTLPTANTPITATSNVGDIGYSCDRYNDYQNILNFWRSPYTAQNQILTGCTNSLVIYNRRYLRQQEGAVLFPSEYRAFDYTEEMSVLIPAGFRYRSGSATFSSSDRGITVPIIDANVIQTADTIRFINLKNFFTPNGGTIVPSDEVIGAEYITFQVNPSCNMATGYYNGTTKYKTVLMTNNMQYGYSNNNVSQQPWYGVGSAACQYTANGGGTTTGLASTWNYTAPQPNLQTSGILTTYSDTVTWALTRQNASNTVPASNSWLHISTLQGTPLNALVLKQAGVAIAPDVNGFYHLGNNPASSTTVYTLGGNVQGCATTKLLVRSGWACSAYPTDINATGLCYERDTLTVTPFPASADAIVTVTPNGAAGTFQFCTPIDVDVILNTSLLGDIENLSLDAALPTGFNLVSSSVQFQYPTTASFAVPSNPAAISQSGTNIHINVDALDVSLNSGLTGAYDLAHKTVRIKFQIKPECGALSGDKIVTQFNARAKCGTALPTITQNISPIVITQAVAQTYITTPSGVAQTVNLCNGPTPVYTYNMTIPIHLYSAPTSNIDTIYVTLPAGADFAGYNPSASGQLNNPLSASLGPVNIGNDMERWAFVMVAGLVTGDTIRFHINYTYDAAEFAANGSSFNEFKVLTGRIVPLVCNSVNCQIISASGLGFTTLPTFAPTVDAGPDRSVACFFNGSTTMLGNGTGVWSLGAGSSGTLSITNPNSLTTDLTAFSTPGTYNMVLTNGTCTDIAQVQVSNICPEDCQNGIDDDGDANIDCLDSECTVAVTATSSVGCVGSSIQFGATANSSNGNGIFSYTWSGIGGYSATGSNPDRDNVTPANNGIYTVTATASTGCSATANTSVSVGTCVEICGNGMDDDNDGFVDAADSDCTCGH